MTLFSWTFKNFPKLRLKDFTQCYTASVQDQDANFKAHPVAIYPISTAFIHLIHLLVAPHSYAALYLSICYTHPSIKHLSTYFFITPLTHIWCKLTYIHMYIPIHLSRHSTCSIYQSSYLSMHLSAFIYSNIHSYIDISTHLNIHLSIYSPTKSPIHKSFHFISHILLYFSLIHLLIQPVYQFTQSLITLKLGPSIE